MVENSSREWPSNIELQPRAKFLFINLSPDKQPHLQMADLTFAGHSGNYEVAGLISPAKKNTKDNSERSNLSVFEFPGKVGDYRAIIVSGSPFSAYPYPRKQGGLLLAFWKKDLIEVARQALEAKVPFLGICNGAQLLAQAAGGRVVEMRTKDGEKVKEIGWSTVRKAHGSVADPVMGDLPDEFVVAQNHRAVVSELPPGAVLLAENEYGVQGFKLGNAYGFEFHPERDPLEVEKYLKDKEKTKKMKKAGLDPVKIAALGRRYDPVVQTIFTNFRDLAWSRAQ